MDKLICINIEPLEGNEIAPPLTIDGPYEIKALHTCECGQEHYHVGILTTEINFVRCWNCKKKLPENVNFLGTLKDHIIHWCHPSRFKIAVVLIVMLFLTSCADSLNVDPCRVAEPYGFWSGFWHGGIILFSWIGSLFSDDIAIYAVNNTGGWYDFGFILGLSSCGIGASKAS